MPHASRAAVQPSAHTPPRLWRDITIDTLRGIGIFIMVAANMAPLMDGPHPLPYRVFSTLAAPLFILISGMMVSRACILHMENRGLLYHIKRGGFLIAIGALLDASAWNIVPFMTMDVLYLIGAMLPVIYLLCRAPKWMPALVAIMCIFITPWLQQSLGYTPYPIEYPLRLFSNLPATGLAETLRHWLIDGWFPLCPWAGYMTLGILMARARWSGAGTRRFITVKWLGLGSALTLFGSLCLVTMPMANFLEREGYSELFYPPTVVILMLSFGVTVLMFSVVDRTRGFVGWQIMRCLGECPLLMYIMHVVLIARVLEPVFGSLSLESFALLYGCFLVWLICMGWALRLIKKASPVSPRPMRWLLGGLEA